MKKAYEIDKTYYDFDPVFGMAMLNHSIPRLFGGSKKEALKYYNEFTSKYTNKWEDYNACLYGADFLRTQKGEQHKEKAKELLEKVINDPNKRVFCIDWARKIMRKL